MVKPVPDNWEDDVLCEFEQPVCAHRVSSIDIAAILAAVAESVKRSPHEEDWEEQLRYAALYQDKVFIDDVHIGRLLPHGEIIKARRLEMDFFRKMGVYHKVHKSQAKGKPVISTRWVDTNKGGRI